MLYIDNGHSFPCPQAIIQNCTYVDDVLFDTDDIPSLRESCVQLTQLMARKRDGFHLRKWTNLIELFLLSKEDIPSTEHELTIEHLLDKNDTFKIFGLTWIPNKFISVFKSNCLN